MLQPLLPTPPSWFPGHMSRFVRLLPQYLTRTDIVLELRDVRLPLTSVNPAFERIITKWQSGRKKMGAGTAGSNVLGERIIVYGKADLVGKWGLKPFHNAIRKCLPGGEHVHFTSHMEPHTILSLSHKLKSLAEQKNDPDTETNVLIVGMPNVGKSSLLNALRNKGISGPTPKALKTGAHPGLTRALSTRLKLNLDPLIYAFDTPGVMLPYLGRGDRGAERAVKLALIAGIKEGLYDIEALVAYLLYRLWILNPENPAYMSLLPPNEMPTDVMDFLQLLAHRMGMIRRNNELDVRRAGVWFVKWWREKAGTINLDPFLPEDDDAVEIQHHTDSSLLSLTPDRPIKRMGWGLDFEWDCDWPVSQPVTEELVQDRMEKVITEYLARMEEEERSPESVSPTQEKKRSREEIITRRLARVKARNQTYR